MHIRFFCISDSSAPFFSDVVPFLAKQQHELTIIIGRTQYRSGYRHLEEILTDPGIKLKVIAVGGIGTRFKPIFENIAYFIGALILSLRRRDTNLNVFLSQPPLFSIWGFVLKVLFRQKNCVLIMDVYPDLIVRAGLLKESSLSMQILKNVSHFSLTRSDLIIVLGRCMKDYLVSKGIPGSKIEVIRNWSNEQDVYPIPHIQNPLRDKFQLKDSFVILYSGNIGVGHFFDDILEVANKLQGVPQIRFVFIGDGSRKQEIIQAKEDYHLDNVILLPYQRDDQLSYSLSLGDIHFVSLRSGFEGLMVPSKAYGAFAVGRPVIYQGAAAGEIARVILEEDIGTVVQPGQPDALRKAILAYYDDSQQVKAQGLKARSLAEGRLSYQNALRQYEIVFKRFDPC